VADAHRRVAACLQELDGAPATYIHTRDGTP
jgi:hypothetical protein